MANAPLTLLRAHRDRIERGDSEQHAADESRQTKRGGKPNRYSAQRERQTLAGYSSSRVHATAVPTYSTAIRRRGRTRVVLASVGREMEALDGGV